jgi:hypothetical protein
MDGQLIYIQFEQMLQICSQTCISNTRAVQKVIGLRVLHHHIPLNLEYFYMYGDRKMFSSI